MLQQSTQTTFTRDNVGKAIFEKLSEALSAELALLEVLPYFARSSFSAELTSTFDLYAAQTDELIAKLTNVFKAMGHCPKQQPTALDSLLTKACQVVRGHQTVCLSGDMALVGIAESMVAYQIGFYEALGELAFDSGFQKISDLAAFVRCRENERLQVLSRIKVAFQLPLTETDRLDHV